MKRHALARRAVAVASTLVFIAAVLALMGASAPEASAAVTQRYCETTPITGIGGTGTTGSTIDVAGFVGPAATVSVTLLNVGYTMANATVVQLRHPGGGSMLVNSPDALDAGPSYALWGDFTFDDAAVQRLPGPAGTYRPSQPLSSLAGRSPNGRWSLSVMGTDPTGQRRGAFYGGWCLTFEAAPAAVPTSTTASVTPTFSAYGDPVTVDPEVTGSPSPTRGTISYSLDGAAFKVPSGTSGTGAFGAPFVLSQQSPGTHTVQLRYTDPTGAFESSTSVPLGFIVAARGPSVAARLSSLHALSRWGWYRSPVTATFTCDGGGVAIARCSSPVVVSGEGQAQEVTGSVLTADGDTDVVTTSISIDRTVPTVRAAGVRDGHTYRRRTPYIRCVGADSLSGLAACRVVVRQIGRGAYRYRVVAVDRAGNTSRQAGLYFRR